jgi:hypothetical protein
MQTHMVQVLSREERVRSKLLSPIGVAEQVWTLHTYAPSLPTETEVRSQRQLHYYVHLTLFDYICLHASSECDAAAGV